MVRKRPPTTTVGIKTVVDGIEHIVDAFLGMLRCRNTGKIIVRASSTLIAGFGVAVEGDRA